MEEPTNGKKFGLKNSEVVLLSNINAQANAMFSMVVSYILVDRLAYEVTEQTRFRVSDTTIEVWEEAPEPTPEPENTTEPSIAEAAKGDN